VRGPGSYARPKLPGGIVCPCIGPAVAVSAITLAVVVAVLLPASFAGARTRSHVQTPQQAIVAASARVKKIANSRFARGQRGHVLAALRVAVRFTRGRHSACSILAAADTLVSELQLPSTWKRGRVPRGVIRRPVGLLSAAERSLMRTAGRLCATLPKQTRQLHPNRGGSGFTPLPPPVEGPEQGVGPPLPLGKFHPPKTIGGQAGLGPDLQSHAARRGSGPPASIASNPLNFFRNSDVGIPPAQASPQEPTTAEGDNVVWYTGNSSDGLSTNAGRTFTLFNPSTILPDNGLPFCCDQEVSYSPQRNLFVWVMQYWCGAGSSSPATNNCTKAGTASNRVRIAVATPQTLVADAASPGAAWTYWDITPQTFGQPAGSWFDRSDMGVNIWNMQWTVDVLRANKGVASLLTRVSLADLANRGTISISYITNANQRIGVAQGLNSTTTYYVGDDSLSEDQIWSFAAFSGTMFRHDINHSSVPNLVSPVDGTDGNDWYDRYPIFGGQVDSATVSGNTLYTAQGTGRDYCTANCSSKTPTLKQELTEPAVFTARYDVNSWTDVGERWIWNPTLAFGWPALQTDGAGDVGLVFRASAANQNAQPVAGFLTPAEQFVFAEPAGLPHETGDYYSLRPGRTSQSFVMTAQTVETDAFGNPQMHWEYIEYGHGASPYVAPPNVRITAPANQSSFKQGTSVTYSATVSDPVDGTLPNAAIVWSEDGSTIGTGPTIHHVENTAGTHTITVKAINGDGKSASQSITISVNAPLAPTVAITAPPNGDTGICRTITTPVAVQFTATASDPNSPPESLTYSWTDSINGGTPSPVSTQLSPSLSLACEQATANGTRHELTLIATNTSGKSTSAQVQVIVHLG
jgi:PKD domain